MTANLRKGASVFNMPTVKKSSNQEIDPDLLVVEHDKPVPRMKSRTSDKYGPVFAKLKPGSCIKCEAHEVNPIANQLRKAILLERLPALKGCTLISRQRCDDGAARVWVVKEEKKC